MFIPNDDKITPSVDKNYLLKSFDTKLNNQTDQNYLINSKIRGLQKNDCICKSMDHFTTTT